MAAKLSLSEFVTRANTIHAGKYTYELCDYKNSYTKVIITCPYHGEFLQRPDSHLKGYGCLKCQHEKLSVSMGGGYENFVIKANAIHHNKYDYTHVEYETAFKNIKIICPIHGEFEQMPCNHINRSAGCPKCGNSYSPSTAEFVSELTTKYGIHDYSKVVYTSAHDPIIIGCPTHGDFEIVATTYKRSGKCPNCYTSKQQTEVYEYVRSLGVTAEQNNRSIIAPRELDIVIPSAKLAIEFNGNYYHSYNRIETLAERTRHKDKVDRCIAAGFRLFQISTHELDRSRGLIQSMLRQRLGLANTIAARKCEIIALNENDAGQFFAETHISGHRPAQIYLGLIHDDTIACAISFTRYKEFYEIIRLASALDTVVVGGLSKLLNYFKRIYDPDVIMTFADRRYGEGNGYAACGFNRTSTTQPGYIYLDDRCIPAGSRVKFQKHRLEKLLPVYDAQLTEADNMFRNGYRRMWDSGHHKYIWKK